ncbi:MAG: adenosylcobinamide-GDP ribazoletransferase [Anaerolineales bacterium]|uniref:adenosylcobinamide-GDP ribazoletransferase n=1 Tax=Candidatus Villigracilis vicinus TaxID=3140679 RepID=UPI00313586D4|nr:adenosylcobinamide-GDP ribazoletransferase [Anaerolineales bacterium]MBK9780464.1 adenosylcobinamide-GDP ribazoletransferase [Anaerolineales bacterium]
MTSLIAAFQFLTIFPTIIKRMFTSQEMGRAVGWFPLVGVLLGFALYGVNRAAALLFPQTVSAALTLCAWIAFTRFFHLDGFMDTLDGLFGGWTPERRLEIMKDSRMGAFGTIGGILVLLTQYAALSSTLHLFPSIMLATTLGRWASPLVIYAFPYAREDGLGIEMKRNVTFREIIIATLIAGITSWLVLGWLGFAFMVGAALIAYLTAAYTMRLIPGLTGDIYGTVTTLVEMLILVAFTANFI